MLTKDKFIELLLYSFLIFVGFVGGIQFNDYLKNKQQKKTVENIKIPSEFIVSNDQEISTFERLKALKKFIETIDIDTYYKEKILKDVDNALYVSESDLYKKLGKNAYEKEFRERKADLSKENL